MISSNLFAIVITVLLANLDLGNGLLTPNGAQCIIRERGGVALEDILEPSRLLSEYGTIFTADECYQACCDHESGECNTVSFIAFQSNPVCMLMHCKPFENCLWSKYPEGTAARIRIEPSSSNRTADDSSPSSTQATSPATSTSITTTVTTTQDPWFSKEDDISIVKSGDTGASNDSSSLNSTLTGSQQIISATTQGTNLGLDSIDDLWRISNEDQRRPNSPESEISSNNDTKVEDLVESGSSSDTQTSNLTTATTITTIPTTPTSPPRKKAWPDYIDYDLVELPPSQQLDEYRQEYWDSEKQEWIHKTKSTPEPSQEGKPQVDLLEGDQREVILSQNPSEIGVKSEQFEGKATTNTYSEVADGSIDLGYGQGGEVLESPVYISASYDLDLPIKVLVATVGIIALLLFLLFVTHRWKTGSRAQYRPLKDDQYDYDYMVKGETNRLA